MWTMIMPVAVMAVDDATISRIDIKCVVDKSGSARITETWTLSAEDGTEVYKDFSDMNEKTITLVSVKEDNTTFDMIDGEDWDVDADIEDKAQKCALRQDVDGFDYEICLGLGSYGTHTFVMTYDITKFVNQYEDAQGINYAFLSDMAVNVEDVSVKVTSKAEDFNADTNKIWGFGYVGSVVFDDGAIVMQSEEDVDDNKVQLLSRSEDKTYKATDQTYADMSYDAVLEDAQAEAEWIDEADEDIEEDDIEEDDDGTLWGMFFAIGMCVIAGLTGLIARYAYRKETHRDVCSDGTSLRQGYKDVHPFRDLPTKDITYFYYLARKAGLIGDDERSGLMSGCVLKWIREGQVTCTKSEDKSLFGRGKERVDIDMTQPLVTDDESERELYDMFVEAAGSDRVLRHNGFKRWCAKNDRDVFEWFDMVEERVEDSLKAQGLLTEKEGAEVGFIFRKHEVNMVYDTKVRDDLLKVAGFKKFLADEDNMDEKKAIEVRLWDEYLIFAAVLGLAKTVSGQLGGFCPQTQMTNDDMMMYYLMTDHMMRSGYTQAYGSYAANNGTAFAGGGGASSFNGGGGGFSGGGGGGVR